MDPAARLAANIRRHRLKAGLTQEALQQATGVHMTEISRLERGVRDPRLTTIVRVARGLGVSAAELVKGVR